MEMSIAANSFQGLAGSEAQDCGVTMPSAAVYYMWFIRACPQLLLNKTLFTPFSQESRAFPVGCSRALRSGPTVLLT